MANLTQLIEQAGHEYRAYRVMLLGLILGVAVGALVLMVSPVWWRSWATSTGRRWSVPSDVRWRRFPWGRITGLHHPH
jgi:tight adherence protein B